MNIKSLGGVGEYPLYGWSVNKTPRFDFSKVKINKIFYKTHKIKKISLSKRADYKKGGNLNYLV